MSEEFSATTPIEAAGMVWSPCGKNVILRANTSITTMTNRVLEQALTDLEARAQVPAEVGEAPERDQRLDAVGAGREAADAADGTIIGVADATNRSGDVLRGAASAFIVLAGAPASRRSSSFC